MKMERMSVAGTHGAIDQARVDRIRADFPILKLQISGKPLVYLDNAASSQMPQQVIDRIVRYQTEETLQHPPRSALPERTGHARNTRRRVSRYSIS